MIFNQDLQISLLNVGNTQHTKFGMQKKMLTYYKKSLYTRRAGARALYELCVDSIQKSLLALDASLSGSNIQDLYLALHNLKGTLGSTGLKTLMDDASVLSMYAKALTKGEIDTISLGFLEAIEKFKGQLFVLCKESA